MKTFLKSTLLLLTIAGVGQCYPSELPTRNLVGVAVTDTPIIRDAITFAEGYEDNTVFNHSMRSWIFGSMIVARNPAYTKLIDMEVHALGTILHDVGFDPKMDHTKGIDPDHPAKGAKAVRDFLAKHPEGKQWKESRVQILIDSVTLHLEDSDSSKALEIRAVRDGQQIDLRGPKGYVSQQEYDSVVAAYPLGQLKVNGDRGHEHPKSSMPQGHSHMKR